MPLSAASGHCSPRQRARLGRWFCASHPSTQALAYLPSVVLNRRRARDTLVIHRARFRFPVKYKVHFTSNFLFPFSLPLAFIQATTMDWKKTAKDKADSILDLIPKEWRLEKIPSVEEQRDVTGPYVQQFLSKQEVEITETDAVSIVAHTSSGKWKSVDVAKAFCHRAALAHQLLGCLHEIFFDAAIKDAEELDKYYAKHKKPIGPLHGLPVSLKDQFHVKGVETHMGYVGWIGTFQGKKGTGKEKQFESEMVRELRQLGAILYVKTSVPHTLMAGETVNNIIGWTKNAKNRNLSSGGSSGGEGSLIGFRGSPVGFGTE
jgi:amidase